MLLILNTTFVLKKVENLFRSVFSHHDPPPLILGLLIYNLLPSSFYSDCKCPNTLLLGLSINTERKWTFPHAEVAMILILINEIQEEFC